MGDGIPRAPQARTRLARRAVLDAARTLFLERGYGATTIGAVSERADVPQATLYRLFGSKQGILKALLDTSVAGDDEPVPVAERPQVQALLRAPDAAERLAGLAALTVDINARTAPIYRILVSAAGSDPEAAVLLEDLARQRGDGQRRVATSLAESGALRPDLAVADAADLIHALASPEVYALLVVERGWTPDRFERWLASALADQLLAPPSP